jgi:hypothetical protein
LTATSKSFRIDHPLSPKTKYLVHGCVESNEFKNVYDGTAVVNSDGKVMIVLPKYFQALNEEFRYQLTAIGSACPNLHISKEIAENSFEIGGGEPGVKVCWQVTGVRHDPSAASHPLEVEPEKKGHERNRYLDPKAYGQPLSAGVDADSLAEGQRRARDLEVRTKQAQTWPKAGPVIPRPQANP